MVDDIEDQCPDGDRAQVMRPRQMTDDGSIHRA